MPPGQKPVSAIFEADRVLENYLKVSDAMGRYSNTLYRALPEELRQEVRIRYFREGELAVNVTSGAVATRVKMIGETLVSRLSTNLNFQGITHIATRVRPGPSIKSRKGRKPAISKRNGELLEAVANETRDKGLKQALQRLAKRSRQANPVSSPLP